MLTECMGGVWKRRDTRMDLLVKSGTSYWDKDEWGKEWPEGQPGAPF